MDEREEKCMGVRKEGEGRGVDLGNPGISLY